MTDEGKEKKQEGKEDKKEEKGSSKFKGLMSGLLGKSKEATIVTGAALGGAGLEIGRGAGKAIAKGTKSIFSMQTFFFFLVLLLHWSNLSNRSGGFSGTWFFGVLLVYLLAIGFLGKTYFCGEWKTALLLSFFSFILPYFDLLYLLPGLKFLQEPLMALSTNTLFMGLIALANPWIIYVLFGPVERNWLVGLGTISYLFIVLILLFQQPALQDLAVKEGVFETAKSVTYNPVWTSIMKGIPVALEFIWDGLKNFPTTIKNLWERGVAEATGDYYTGQVEQTKNEQIGVYLEDVQSLRSQFLSDEPVVVSFTLKARGLDKPIKIKPSCKAKLKDGEISGTIPLGESKDELEISTYEKLNLECDFEPQSTSPEDKRIELDRSTEVEVNAEFSMKTISYLKEYFIDFDRKLSLDKQQIDPFTQYKIIDRNPTTQFSNGPIMIGMNVGDPLTSIKKGRMGPTFKVTVDNRWQGKLTKIKKMVVYIPEGLEADKTRCRDFSEVTFAKGDEYYQENYKTYALDLEKTRLNAVLADLQNVRSYLNFVCGTTIVDAQKLLGQTPITTQYFKTTIEYDYTSTAKTAVYVKKSPEQLIS